MIVFNQPTILGTEIKQLEYEEHGSSVQMLGDSCIQQLKSHYLGAHIELTHSCTAALEAIAIAINIQKGDEVIMPSFTFVATANAFALRGAKIVFVDIDPNTMNINPLVIEEAITDKTKAIVVVHYAGISCEMNHIMNVARRHDLIVIEDAAHSLGAFYKKKPLGLAGDFATLSFHHTKNIQCWEGGALIVNDKKWIDTIQQIINNGTNRAAFQKGLVNRYTWTGLGSNYRMSRLNANWLYFQLEALESITQKRLKDWHFYYEELSELENLGYIRLPKIRTEVQHNGHVFFLKCKSLRERIALVNHLETQKIQPTFHYIPLHSSKGGQQYGRFHGEDIYTTFESECLLRLPLFHAITNNQIEAVCQAIFEFYL